MTELLPPQVDAELRQGLNADLPDGFLGRVLAARAIADQLRFTGRAAFRAYLGVAILITILLGMQGLSVVLTAAATNDLTVRIGDFATGAGLLVAATLVGGVAATLRRLLETPVERRHSALRRVVSASGALLFGALGCAGLLTLLMGRTVPERGIDDREVFSAAFAHQTSSPLIWTLVMTATCIAYIFLTRELVGRGATR